MLMCHLWRAACGKVDETLAALPPHSAVRLCLTGCISKIDWRLRLRLMRLSLKKEWARKGGAFPHCAAAKPHWLIEGYIGKFREWQAGNMQGDANEFPPELD
jgi:hypothetical protein